MIPTSRPSTPPLAVPTYGSSPDVALDVDAAVAVSRDHGSTRDLDLILRIELLQVGERLVGVPVVLRVFAEGDDQHVVR
jgi:hypothetical protein